MPPGTVPPGAMPPGAAPVSPGAVVEPRKRLHPLSPLLSGAKSIAIIVVALSWQTLSQIGVERFALVVVVLAAGVVVFSLIGWLNTGYHVVGRELRIQDGLLWRRNRAIPLERLQSVELRRPLLAQLTGLAELRLEVVGGGKTEAPLAYLTVRDAAQLRERLLALAGRTPGNVVAPTAGPAAAAPGVPALERPLLRVRNSDLLISQLLTPQAFFLPFGVAFVIMQFVMEGAWTFIGIASTITAMAGVLLQPVRRVLQDWDFRLARDAGERLVVRYGLVETRSQVVPLHRVQSVGATWPLLWRGKGWLHLRLDIAGYAGPQNGNDKRSDRLLPVGDNATARALVWDVLPGVDLVALPTTPPPDRARWLHPFALRRLGAGLTAEVFVTRWGLLTRELSLVPYARLQSVRVVQGPIQRRLRLATVYADTAGGRSGAARDRDLGEAWALAHELAERARLARGRAPLATGRGAAHGFPAPGPSTGGMPGSGPASLGSPAAPFSGPVGAPAAAPQPGPTDARPPATAGGPPASAPPSGPADAHQAAAADEDHDAYWRRPPGA
jgi:putative membrane protein